MRENLCTLFNGKRLKSRIYKSQKLNSKRTNVPMKK
jgi:hypothetical protein